MNAEVYNLWAHWMNRQESAEQCAQRMAATLIKWADAHEIFSRWNRMGKTRAQRNLPFSRMPPQVEELTQIFQNGRAHKDVPKVPWPELGYSVGAWNGTEQRFVAFHLRPGHYDIDSIFFPNSLEILLPKRTPETTDIINSPVLRKVLLGVIDGWEPSWASVSSASYDHRLHERESGPSFPLFRSGWMTYLSAPYARRITPPASAIVEDTEDGGMLLLATNETFTVDNPKHVAVADEIQRALAPLQNDGEKWRQARGG